MSDFTVTHRGFKGYAIHQGDDFTWGYCHEEDTAQLIADALNGHADRTREKDVAIGNLAKDCDYYRTQIAKLQEALAPFAKAFREVPGSAWAHATAHIDDFRRAAQVMKEIEG